MLDLVRPVLYVNLSCKNSNRQGWIKIFKQSYHHPEYYFYNNQPLPSKYQYGAFPIPTPTPFPLFTPSTPSSSPSSAFPGIWFLCIHRTEQQLVFLFFIILSFPAAAFAFIILLAYGCCVLVPVTAAPAARFALTMYIHPCLISSSLPAFLVCTV